MTGPQLWSVADYDDPSRFDRVHHANYDSPMSKRVIIEELPHDPEFERLFAQAERNRVWFTEHARELEVFKKYRGRYVAAAGAELFVADTPEEVESLVRDKYPEEVPHVRYILREKRDRIYAYQRAVTTSQKHSERGTLPG